MLTRMHIPAGFPGFPGLVGRVGLETTIRITRIRQKTEHPKEDFSWC